MVKPVVSFTDFAKLDLRVGTIEACEEVVGSEKLLKFLVNLGEPPHGLGKRTILAGVKKNFKPEELIGLQVLVLANLEPKKMMGLESQGMILMAVERQFKIQSSKLKVDRGTGNLETKPEEKITLLVPQDQVPEGTRVE